MRRKLIKLFITAVSLIVCNYVGTAQTTDTQSFIEVPFTFEHAQIILTVKINNKGPYSMLLDTGTNVSAVDLASAREIGLKVGTTGFQGTGGGTDKNPAYMTELPLIQVGELVARDTVAAAIDLSKLSQRLGRSIHGVLGYTLLKNRIVEIDYPRRAVRFYSSSPIGSSELKQKNANTIALPFRLVDRIPIIDVYVNGKKITAVVDTGSSLMFSLKPKAISRLGLQEEADRAQPDTAVGYNGEALVRNGKINRLSVGEIVLEMPDVTFLMKGMGHDDSSSEGSIGNVFLKDFVVTFDYTKKTVIFKRLP